MKTVTTKRKAAPKKNSELIDLKKADFDKLMYQLNLRVDSIKYVTISKKRYVKLVDQFMVLTDKLDRLHY